MSTQRTIDETGKDVTEQRGRQVTETLCLRPDPDFGKVAEWVQSVSDMPTSWKATFHMRTRIILDNET